MNSNEQLRLVLRNLASRGKDRGLLLILVVLLSSCSGSSRNDDEIPDDQPGIPTSPGNVQGTVYSSTDAKLTWEAAQDDGLIMDYEILRDGEPTGPLLDALSYYDPELESDTSYLYSIVAVDEQGNRSQPAEITLRTEDGPALPTINRANYARLLGEVFDVYRGARYETPLLELDSLALDDSLGSSTLEGHF